MNVKYSLPVLIGILVLLLASCTGADSVPATLTPAEEPTLPPSPTATSTPKPTDTPVPAPTEKVEPLPTETQEPTPTPEPPTPTPLPETGELTNPGWQVETVDSGIKPAVGLDSQGKPHITYMVEREEGYVKYAYLDGDDWSLNIVAEGYFYGPPAIAINNSDLPNIVWHDHQDMNFVPKKGDAVRAVLSTDGTWTVGAIKHEGHDGWDNSITIDSQGTVHTASIDPSQFESEAGVEYAVRTQSWKVEAIGSGPIAYEFGTAIAVDDQNLPGITYYNDITGELMFAHKSSEGDWQIVAVDDGDTGKFSSLAFDALGQPHISYFAEESESSGTIRYAFRVDSVWQIEDVDIVTDVKQGGTGARHLTWLEIDSQGRPHIAYNDRSQLKYAFRNEEGWQIEVVSEAGEKPFGQLVVMDLDDQDQPHLVYTVFVVPAIPQGVVRYAVRQP